MEESPEYSKSVVEVVLHTGASTEIGRQVDLITQILDLADNQLSLDERAQLYEVIRIRANQFAFKKTEVPF